MNRIARLSSLAAACSVAGTVALADCGAELDDFVASIAQDPPGAAPIPSADSLEPIDPDSHDDAAAAGTIETGSFTGNLEELQEANRRLAREMEGNVAAKEAAAQSFDEGGFNDRFAAIEQARTALAAGDEAGCMAALARARAF